METRSSNMNREHLYRGKCIFIGKWVFGSLLTTDGACLISEKGKAKDWVDGDVSYSTNWTQVDPSTVGQYTGLLDKNGTRIFEGDIVRLDGDIFFVAFNDAAFGLSKSGDDKRGNLYHWYKFCKPTHEPYVPEVIGNVADNPELLEVNNA